MLELMTLPSKQSIESTQGYFKSRDLYTSYDKASHTKGKANSHNLEDSRSPTDTYQVENQRASSDVHKYSKDQ